VITLDCRKFSKFFFLFIDFIACPILYTLVICHDFEIYPSVWRGLIIYSLSHERKVPFCTCTSRLLTMDHLRHDAPSDWEKSLYYRAVSNFLNLVVRRDIDHSLHVRNGTFFSWGRLKFCANNLKHYIIFNDILCIDYHWLET